MWWKMAGELVAKYYAAREEVEKDVEGGRQIYAEAMSEGSNFLLLIPDSPNQLRGCLLFSKSTCCVDLLT